MTDDSATELTSERRCWPCTVANAAVAFLVAIVPVFAAIARGYLPYSETIARRTGLHERIGPGKKD